MNAAAAFGVGLSAIGALPGWIAQAATAGLIAAVWQGIVLSAAVALVLRLLPKTPAPVRFAIWFGLFLVVAALPSFALFGSRAAGSGRSAWLILDERDCFIVAAVWAIASLVRAVTLVLAVFRVRSLWKQARPLKSISGSLTPVAQPRGFAMVCEQAGSRQAELCVSSHVDRPTVIGFFSPKILIPAWLVEKLSPAELEQIVLHEAGHLSRADDWMNLLQKLALVICPLNPALAWVERRLCFERELACDERVLRTTGAPKAYAACLASLAEHRLGRRSLALALGALGRESELARRVRRILCRPQRMRPLHARLLLGGAVLGLVAAAAGLERFPQLVGFASSADAAAAATQPPHLDARVPDGFVFQPVVFHPPASRIVGSPANLPRAIHTPQTGRRKPLARPTVPWTAPSNAATYPPLQASVTESAASRTIELATQPAQGQDDDPSVSNAIAPAADRAVVQWLVVTSWREQDGSRLTLTTFHSVRTTAEAAPASGNQSLPAQDQVHPFAAVPVRGGWLVIQL